MSSGSGSELKDILTILGGVLGAIAFVWRLWDAVASHLELELQIAQCGPRGREVQAALVKIGNSSPARKHISYAALFIGSIDSSLTSLAADIAALPEIASSAGTSFGPMRRIYLARPLKAIFSPDGRIGIIPLPFFFVDQSHLGNEQLQQRIILDETKLRADQNYGAYLVVMAEHSLGVLRWRATQDALLT